MERLDLGGEGFSLLFDRLYISGLTEIRTQNKYLISTKKKSEQSQGVQTCFIDFFLHRHVSKFEVFFLIKFLTSLQRVLSNSRHVGSRMLLLVAASFVRVLLVRARREIPCNGRVVGRDGGVVGLRSEVVVLPHQLVHFPGKFFLLRPVLFLHEHRVGGELVVAECGGVVC